MDNVVRCNPDNPECSSPQGADDVKVKEKKVCDNKSRVTMSVSKVKKQTDS